MAVFKQGEVVRVPFPHTDTNTRQHRPALIVNAKPIGENAALLWVAMITSADNQAWPGDVAIPRLKSAGLPAASVVRTAKIATIEAPQAERIGSHTDTALTAVMDHIRATITSPTAVS